MLFTEMEWPCEIRSCCLDRRRLHDWQGKLVKVLFVQLNVNKGSCTCAEALKGQ